MKLAGVENQLLFGVPPNCLHLVPYSGAFCGYVFKE
jgi:hypothetical protein